MDEKQAQRINAAAQQFAEAVRESLQTVSERSVEAQERSRMLTQQFFDSVTQELRAQAESNRAAGEQLAEQSRRQQEAFQQLSQESIDAYRDFLNSMFSYYQENIERARRSARG